MKNEDGATMLRAVVVCQGRRTNALTCHGPRHGPEDGAAGRALGGLPDHGRSRRSVVMMLLRRRLRILLLGLGLGFRRLRLEGGPQVHDFFLELLVLSFENADLLLEGGNLFVARSSLTFSSTSGELGREVDSAQHALGLEAGQSEVVDKVAFAQRYQQSAVHRVVPNFGHQMAQFEGNEKHTHLVDAVILGVLHLLASDGDPVGGVDSQKPNERERVY
jgi:hypothetical protein